ncbi:MAG TPA: hypothetical protein OIL77_01265 [Coriobacteriaceae bacterium]|nr:hypothetical protein [Coriobacteriaceae bacterium]
MNTTHLQTAGTVLQARIDRALHGGYDANFAAATIANFALLPIDEALSNHEFSANRCAEIMNNPAIHKLTDPYLGPHGKTNGPYTMGHLAHMVTALDTKLRLEMDDETRMTLMDHRYDLQNALTLPIHDLAMGLNALEARHQQANCGQDDMQGPPGIMVLDRERYNRATAGFQAGPTTVRALIDMLRTLSLNRLFDGYRALAPVGLRAQTTRIIDIQQRQFKRYRDDWEMSQSIVHFYQKCYDPNKFPDDLERRLHLVYTAPIATLLRLGAFDEALAKAGSHKAATELERRLECAFEP